MYRNLTLQHFNPPSGPRAQNSTTQPPRPHLQPQQQPFMNQLPRVQRRHFMYPSPSIATQNMEYLVKNNEAIFAEQPPIVPSLFPTNTQISHLSYKDAIEVIKNQTGPMVAILKNLPDRNFTAVLYTPVGATLAVQDGIVLNSDTSIPHLITLLQMYVDQHITKEHHDDSFIIDSIKIRFGNKEDNDQLPPLTGKPWFEILNGDGDQAASLVMWEVSGSELETYWEAYRSMIQASKTEQDPVFKVHTVRLLSTEKTLGRILDKKVGTGHYFKHNASMLDAKECFATQGFDDSLLAGMAEAVAQKVRNHPDFQNAGSGSTLSNPAVNGRLNSEGISVDNDSVATSPNHIKNIIATRTSIIPRQSIMPFKNTFGFSSEERSTAQPPTAETFPIREQLRGKTSSNGLAFTSQKAGKFVEFTAHDGSLQKIFVENKPLFHPVFNWSVYQKMGGEPERHEAFSLGHVPFEPSTFGAKDLVGTGKTVVSDALAKLPQHADKFVTIYDQEKGEIPIEGEDDDTPTPGNRKGKSVGVEQNETFWAKHERNIGFDEEDDDKFISTVQAPSAHLSRGITKLQARQRFLPNHHHQAGAAAAKQGLQLVIRGNSGNKEEGSSQQFNANPALTPNDAAPGKFDFSSNLASLASGSVPTFGRFAFEMSSSSNLNVNAPSFESPMSSSMGTTANALEMESPHKQHAQLNLNVAALQAFGRSESPAASSGSFNVNARPYSPGWAATRANSGQPSQFRLQSRSPVKRGSVNPGKSDFLPHTNIPNVAYHSQTSSVGSQDARNYAPYGMQAGGMQASGFGDVPSLHAEYSPALFQNSPHQRSTSRFMSSNMFGNAQMLAGNSFSGQQPQDSYHQVANYSSQQNLTQYGAGGGMGSAGRQQAQGQYNPATQHFGALSQQLEYGRQMYPSQTVDYFSGHGQGFDGQGGFEQ